jgi:glycosyltransferase involved in cell wall biosynthesis
MYTGTLGLKHNAGLIIELASHFRDNPNVRVVVVSEGLGAKSLEESRRTLDLDNLEIKPYQPIDQYADVLASADVLIAMIEPDAGFFSVPSKVLSYLCAQRPILLSVPAENLAARIVTDHHAGIVVDPTDSGAFIAGAEKLIHNRELRESLAMNGRQYAEDNFDIQVVADKFEEILQS